MCGRYFVNTNLSEAVETALSVFMEPETGHDVTPGMSPQVILMKNGKMTAVRMKWGMDHPSGRSLIINAKSETAPDKPMFKNHLLFHRCVIPASRFYEWDRDKNKAVFDLPGAEVMFLAGFCTEPDENGRFVILTTEANGSVIPVHDRMPLIIPEKDVCRWLADPGELNSFLSMEMPLLDRTQEYEQFSLF